jgi:hypothetical protein
MSVMCKIIYWLRKGCLYQVFFSYKVIPDYIAILKASQEEFQEHRSSMDHHQLEKFLKKLMTADLHF